MFAYVLRMIRGDEPITEFFKGTGPPHGAGDTGAGWWCLWPGSFWTGSRSCSSSCPAGTSHPAQRREMTWFLILVALMLQTSFLTPPVGFCCSTHKGGAQDVTIRDIYLGGSPSYYCRWPHRAAACCSADHPSGCPSRCTERRVSFSAFFSVSASGTHSWHPAPGWFSRRPVRIW